MGDKTEGFEPGTLGCHEALHMTAFLMEAVGTELCEHEAIMANDKWEKLAVEAHRNLYELYQAIGREHL